MQVHQLEGSLMTLSQHRKSLVNALWRARERMDRAESDGEYEACRQLEIVARDALEQFDWKHPAANQQVAA